jgi:type IV pilus assembly protein PilW
MRGTDQGFTLMEILVAMAISGIVMGSIYMTYYSQQRSYILQEQVAAMQQNHRTAMYYMEREIRMAGYNPTWAAGADLDTDGVDNDCDTFIDGLDPEGDESTSIGIITNGANSINFTIDDNGDGDICDTNENITYALDGSDLVRNNAVIAENMVSLAFDYLDENNISTPTLADIRSVQITLTARTDDNSINRVLTTQIRCRNL